jgi:transposase-like protein
MTPGQLGRLFRRHYGEASRLARELGCTRQSLSRWFRGHVVSARIEMAVAERAKELLRGEAANVHRVPRSETRSAV